MRRFTLEPSSTFNEAQRRTQIAMKNDDRKEKSEKMQSDLKSKLKKMVTIKQKVLLNDERSKFSKQTDNTLYQLYINKQKQSGQEDVQVD